MLTEHNWGTGQYKVSWRNGSALVSGTKGCAFESHRDRILFLPFSLPFLRHNLRETDQREEKIIIHFNWHSEKVCGSLVLSFWPRVPTSMTGVVQNEHTMDLSASDRTLASGSPGTDGV